MVKRLLDGAVGESSANQQICKLYKIYGKSGGLQLAVLGLQQAGTKFG